MYQLVNITPQVSDTLATAVSDGPTNNQILLMVSAFILVMGLILWNRLAPSRLTASFTFHDDVKKAWLFMDYRKLAAAISLEDMYTTLSGCDLESKKTIHLALIAVLDSDGDFATDEKVWFDEAMQRIH